MAIAQKLMFVQLRVYDSFFACFPAISRAQKFRICVQVCIYMHTHTVDTIKNSSTL